MAHGQWEPAAALAMAVVCTLGLMPPASASAQGPKVPVVSLETFISVPDWQLDITWNAKDAYEDAHRSAQLDMTATARFYLTRSDEHDAWGRWHVEKVQSGNMAMTSVLVNKHDHSRTEWKPAGAGPDAGVIFEVGGDAPGFRLTVGAAFPVKIINPLLGSMDGEVTLLTSNISREPPVLCTGPLPASGRTIHGSLSIPLPVPPFAGAPKPDTRMGIEFVLQPDPRLAPFTPKKR